MPQPVPEFDALGSLGPFSAAPSRDQTEMLLGASFSVGSQEIVRARFDGLTRTGIASSSSTLTLTYRDGARPGFTYVLAASLGTTGFMVGAHVVPLDPDPLFLATLGTDFPPFTMGFVGTLDADGIATATITDPVSALTGIPVFVAGATLDVSQPFNIGRVSNAETVLFQ